MAALAEVQPFVAGMRPDVGQNRRRDSGLERTAMRWLAAVQLQTVVYNRFVAARKTPDPVRIFGDIRFERQLSERSGWSE